MDIYNKLYKYVSPINNSPYLAGIAMIILNIGSKYVEMGFSKTQEQALKAGIAREILIFSMLFMATKDVIISILMTAAFNILSDHLLNDQSSLCIMPERLKALSDSIDVNNDNIISDEEKQNAIRILNRANSQNLY